MQILLHPPLALILSADAILHYETAAYFVGGQTLGDALQHILLYWNCCSCAFKQRRTSCLRQIKSSEKISESILLKNWRIRASVSNLRGQCQDLERFSVINRFAKFKGVEELMGLRASRASDAAANAQILSSGDMLLHYPCLGIFLTGYIDFHFDN
ncbi:hypothetical protein NC652_028740 [Populus alba x Populus x berolinensis]|nr:hypothetical protein NC652_028740 [Populus alba x Populus x berolinensis]